MTTPAPAAIETWTFATSWHVSVAAESITAALFTRYGYDVSVQYGANQPEYDLMVAKGERLLKISVKAVPANLRLLQKNKAESGIC